MAQLRKTARLVLAVVLLGTLQGRAQEGYFGITAPAVIDPMTALDDPLSAAEEVKLKALALKLGMGNTERRAAVSGQITQRFGMRAALPLTALSGRDLDPERRFRERSLASSLVFGYYLDHAPDCGWLGIRWYVSGTSTRFFSAHVVEAIPGEPAYEHGIRVNDEIVEWNGEPLDNHDDFEDHLQAQEPGSTAEITVERMGVDIKIKVVMGTRHDLDTGAIEYPYPHFRRDMAIRRFGLWIKAANRKIGNEPGRH